MALHVLSRFRSTNDPPSEALEVRGIRDTAVKGLRAIGAQLLVPRTGYEMSTDSCKHCDKDRGVGIERYVIRIRLRSSSRGEGIVE
jgi:hypothetical protein